MPRVPPHFKVRCSIANHRKTVGIWASDSMLAMYVRAGVLAIERYADRNGDTFYCTGIDLEGIAGCRGVANARRKLGQLEATGMLEVGQHGAGWRLVLPNLAKKQGFTPKKRVETDVSSSSASTSSSTSTKKKKEPPSRASPSSQDRPAARVSRGRPESSNGCRKPEAPEPEPQVAFEALCTAIEQATPGASVPAAGTARAGRWLTELRLLHEIGAPGTEPPGWPWETILELIAWLPSHERGEFSWGRVIRSPSKLRKHFATILAEMNAASRCPPKDFSERQQEEFWRLQREREANAG